LGSVFVLVTLVTLVVSCDATRRDWSRCDPDGRCAAGFSCEKPEAGVPLCVAIRDAGMAADVVGAVDAPHAIDVSLDTLAARQEDAADDNADLAILDTAGAAVDVFVPDAPGTCSSDQECTSAEPLCLNFVCAKCAVDSDCAGRAGAPACDATSGRCVACVANKHCAGAAPVCDTANAKCVGCLAATDCTADATKAFCVASQCAGCGAAGATACTGSKPVCAAAGAAAGQCVECIDNSGCSKDPTKGFCVNNACTGCQNAGQGAGQDGGSSPCSGATPVCAATGTSAGRCVACVASTDCTTDPTKPICDSNQCRGCKKDSECAAVSSVGVCGLDSSCPSEGNVIFVQNSSTCSTSNPGAGSAASPFCFPDAAVRALSGLKSVIVVHGTVGPVGPLVFNFPTQPVLVAGQASATIKPPTGGMPPVVSVTAGEVTLRDLTISGGGDTGISVTGVAILHMDRCYVLGNTGSGILTTASAFDIVNTVVASNGGTNFPGVNLGAYTGPGPTKFAFNTVVNNGFGGVVCGATYAVTGILANSNVGLNISPNCQTDATTSTAAPLFSSIAYHLSATSPCVDAAGTACPPDDIDGNSRPQGAACDCGADEYTP